MTQQADIGAALEVIEAQLRFLILEAAFHTPPTEGHEQQYFERDLARRKRNEVLNLLRRKHVASHQQMNRLQR